MYMTVAILLALGVPLLGGCTTQPEDGNGPANVVPVPDEVALKFRPGVLETRLLCYFRPPGPVSDSLRTLLLAQRFSFGSGIVVPRDLGAAIVGYGAMHLRRSSVDDPCTDTLAVALDGTRVPIDNFNRMILVLNNDTAAATVAAALLRDYPNYVDSARVNTREN